MCLTMCTRVYVYIHIHTHVCVYVYMHTHTHIYIFILWSSGQEQIHSLVGWLSKRRDGLIYLIGNPTGPGFATIASDTPVFMDS